MPGHTVEAVLAWMRLYPDLAKWDMVQAMDVRGLNSALHQGHLLRWRNGNAIDPIDGQFDIEHTDVTQYLSGMRLAGPELDLEVVSETRAVAQVAMQVEGTVIALRRPHALYRLAHYDVLDSLHLTFEVPLEAADGLLQIDLQAGDRFALEGLGSEVEQTLGGRVFAEHLADLDDASRCYLLAGMKADPQYPLRAGKDMLARFQRSEDGKRLALVLWTTLMYGRNGNLPGIAPPFLLPDELDDALNQATSLLSLDMLQRVAFAEAFYQLIPGAEYVAQLDDGGKLERLSASTGTLRVPASDLRSRTLELQFEPFELQARTLQARFSATEVEQTWSDMLSVSLKYRPRAGGAAWKTLALQGRFQMHHQFVMQPASDKAFITQGQLLAPIAEAPDVELSLGFPSDMSAQQREEVREAVAYSISKALYNTLAPHLTARMPEQLLQRFVMGESSQLVPQRIEAAINPAVFGSAHSQGAPFRIVGTPRVLKAREVHTFTVDPATPVQWRVTGLPGGSGQWGKIDESSGTYTAPGPNAMGDLATRVLVIALDPVTGKESHALVTVLVHGISVNPLIAVLPREGELALTAGAHGEGKLTWAIATSGPGIGSLAPSADGAACTYTASAGVDEKTWLIDAIEVRDDQGEARTVHVLVEQKQPAVVVTVGESQPDGSVQLEARLNGEQLDDAEWRLPLDGPGSIDEHGVYRDDPAAKANYVLVTASISDPKYGTFEGYLIVPLPLTQHASLLAQMVWHDDEASANAANPH